MTPAQTFPRCILARPACWLAPGLAVLLLGCGATAGKPAPEDAATPTVQVFKNRGALQCGGPGTPPEQMRTELELAGVRVHGAHCGSDGLMRPAVCGGSTGDINLFDIPVADLPRAQALGFAPLSQLGVEARSLPCR